MGSGTKDDFSNHFFSSHEYFLFLTVVTICYFYDENKTGKRIELFLYALHYLFSSFSYVLSS